MTIAHWWMPRWRARRAPFERLLLSIRSWSGTVERLVRHPGHRELSQEVFLRVYQKLDQYRFELAGDRIRRIAFSVATPSQRKRLPSTSALLATTAKTMRWRRSRLRSGRAFATPS
jgi:hypothetical protein